MFDLLDNKKIEISELHRSIVPKYAARWKDLGIQLKIPENHLDIIEADNKKSQECCKAMLQKWMEITPDVTWNMLQKAISNLPTYV